MILINLATFFYLFCYESKGIEMSESGVKKIIKKWRATSNCFKILFALAHLVERSTLMRKYPSSIPGEGE